jgi:hypothetical protein
MMLMTGVSAVTAQTSESNLSRCLSDSTTGKDRKDIVRWFVVSLAQHPALGDLITVSPTQIEEVNKTTAQIFTRLMTVDCKAQMKAAYKSGGDATIENAFGKLGEVAAGEVLADPKVKKATEGFIKFVDLRKLGQTLIGP